MAMDARIGPPGAAVDARDFAVTHERPDSAEFLDRNVPRSRYVRQKNA